MIVALNAGQYKGRRVLVTDRYMHCWIEAEVLPTGTPGGAESLAHELGHGIFTKLMKPKITAADFVLLRQMGIRW